MSETQCCSNCKFNLRLEKLDYSDRGTFHTDMEGFVCMCFGDEGVAEWMIGLDPKDGLCECWSKKEKEGKVNA